MSNSSGYEDVVAGIVIVVGMSLIALFLSNSRVYPLAQREPFLVALANLGQTLLIAMWLFEAVHADIPYISRKIVSQIFVGFIVIPFFVRAWKLFMDAGITKERAEARVGWFINHRRFRTRKFLQGIACVLAVIQVGVCFLSIFTEPQYNLLPAQVGTTTNNDALVTNLPLVYWLVFCLFSIVIARTKDGFFIKWELALVGIGAFTFSLLYRVQSNSKILSFPCTIPSCGLFFACLGWLWLIGCSIIFPLSVACKDPHFSYTRCFRWPGILKLRTRTSQFSTTRSANSHTPDEDYPSYHESQSDMLEPRDLTPEQLAKLKDVPLITFLTYPAGREAFRAFTVREFSVENLLFVEAVAAYRSKPVLTKEDFQTIYDQYICRSAANQVNLPSAITQMLKARQEDPSEFNLGMCFDEAAKHVVKLLQRDAFKRFQNTVEWRAHVTAFNPTEPKGKIQAISPSTSDDNKPWIEMEPSSTLGLVATEPATPTYDFVATHAHSLDYETVSMSSSTSVEPITSERQFSEASISPKNSTYSELI